MRNQAGDACSELVFLGPVGGLILDVQASWLVGGMQRSSGSVNHAAGLCEQKRKSFVPLSSSRHELLGSCHHFWVLVRDVSLH